METVGEGFFCFCQKNKNGNLGWRTLRDALILILGDGATASFWRSSWLQGQAPMDLFHKLFKLAWRKNKIVKEVLCNQNWTRGLWRMQRV